MVERLDVASVGDVEVAGPLDIDETIDQARAVLAEMAARETTQST